MKKESKIVGVSLAAGLFVWVLDALLDFLFFYRGEGSFMEMLIFEIPGHEIYVRSIILIIFIITGVIISRYFKKERNSREKLMSAVQQLKATEQQLRASNQQLDAQNQQLKATEQQLRASNQQLDAQNQQLKATEQQLEKL
ncbi:MAG: hypothetical protein ACQEQC_06570, partial [Elusimicrobiota bacterium]